MQPHDGGGWRWRREKGRVTVRFAKVSGDRSKGWRERDGGLREERERLVAAQEVNVSQHQIVLRRPLGITRGLGVVAHRWSTFTSRPVIARTLLRDTRRTPRDAPALLIEISMSKGLKASLRVLRRGAFWCSRSMTAGRINGDFPRGFAKFPIRDKRARYRPVFFMRAEKVDFKLMGLEVSVGIDYLDIEKSHMETFNTDYFDKFKVYLFISLEKEELGEIRRLIISSPGTKG